MRWYVAVIEARGHLTIARLHALNVDHARSLLDGIVGRIIDLHPA